MADRTRTMAAWTVLGCLALVAIAQFLIASTDAAAANDEGPTPPADCTVDRESFGSNATIEWTHDGAAAEKYVIERSRNGGDWFWTAAPLVPTNSQIVEELESLEDYAFRIRTKAPDGSFSDHSPCQPLERTPVPAHFVVDATAALVRPAEPARLGLGISWLLDSDLHRPRTRSMTAAIDELGASVLRFPFGHMADNYLWNTAPWTGELTPMVASQYETPGLLTPTNRDWSWAVQPDGSFIDAMDFDEFMQVAGATGSSTIVVVNAAAHRYQDGPTYEVLRETAMEWVRYAHDNGLEVDHWQIGNEADHPTDAVLTSAEYSALYLDFVTAMRSIDPSISVGPGLIGLSPFSDEVLAEISGELDFAGAHQYLQFEDHSDWRRADEGLAPDVANMQRIIDASADPDLPIIVTETNSIGANWANGDQITTTKALALLEMLFHQRELPNVVASLLWTSHTPWSGETFVGDDANMFFNDDENQLTPNGMMASLFAETVGATLLESPHSQGNLRVWASVDDASDSMTVHLLNKGTFDHEAVIRVAGAHVTEVRDRIVFAGTTPDDPEPIRTLDTATELNQGILATIVPANGVVVLQFSHATPPPIVINELHYHPAEDAAEFVELFNAGDVVVDVSGFDLDGMLTFGPDTTIPPGGFLVATDSLDAFQIDHPDVPAIGWNAGEDLSDDGELVELRTDQGLLVDWVVYR